MNCLRTYKCIESISLYYKCHMKMIFLSRKDPDTYVENLNKYFIAHDRWPGFEIDASSMYKSNDAITTIYDGFFLYVDTWWLQEIFNQGNWFLKKSLLPSVPITTRPLVAWNALERYVPRFLVLTDDHLGH